MQRVVVVPHSPSWTREFATASQAIVSALGDNLLEIHHIGSTAIPGIHAKPIIDMLAVVADLMELDFHTLQLEALGYEAKGEFGIPDRRYFRRNDSSGVRTHQIHAFEIGSPHIERHLTFRDFMRSHEELAMQYSELKQKLAAAHPNDIEAYMDGKDAFIQEIQAQALRWAASKLAKTS